MFKCPYCGKFTSNVSSSINGFDEIVAITGVCKTHGEVNVMDNNDWCYEEFFPEGD